MIRVNTFLENAQRIFDVARTDSGAGSTDFALLVRPDGSLHMVMESPMSLDAVAIDAGARAAYRVTRSREGVRVTGRDGEQKCVLEDGRGRHAGAGLLRDQPLYLITSPLLTSATATS